MLNVSFKENINPQQKNVQKRMKNKTPYWLEQH